MQVRYSLVVTHSNGEIRDFPLQDLPITVGRLPTSTIRVQGSAVSRQHCVVIPTGVGLTVLDQGSTNGTYVNGYRRQHARLHHNDEIKVGDTTLRVEAKTDGKSDVRPHSSHPSPPSTNTNAFLPEQQVGFMLELGKNLSKVRNVSSVFETVLQSIIDAFPVQRAVILARKTGPNTSKLKVIGSKINSLQPVPQDQLDRKLVARVITSGKAECYVPDPNGDGVKGAKEAKKAENSKDKTRRAWGPTLCAPILRKGKSIGVVYADTNIAPEWFDRIEVLDFFCGPPRPTSCQVSKHFAVAFLEFTFHFRAFS